MGSPDSFMGSPDSLAGRLKTPILICMILNTVILFNMGYHARAANMGSFKASLFIPIAIHFSRSNYFITNFALIWMFVFHFSPSLFGYTFNVNRPAHKFLLQVGDFGRFPGCFVCDVHNGLSPDRCLLPGFPGITVHEYFVHHSILSPATMPPAGRLGLIIYAIFCMKNCETTNRTIAKCFL